MTDIILYHPIKIRQQSAQMPLSLMAISACLKQNGYSVKIIDYGKNENAEKEALEYVDGAILFGLTAMVGSSIIRAISIAKKVREKSKIPIVWGGQHVSLLAEQTIQNPYVDVVVRGQGEETIVELANAFKNNLPLKDIKGITYKENGKIISTPDRPFKDINEFPMLDYDAIDVKKYIQDGGSLQYVATRGCPHRCKFCSIKTFYGRAYLKYSPERVVNEIEMLTKKFGADIIGFMDDNFFVDKKWVGEIFKLMEEKNIKIKWGTTCRCDYFSRFDDSFLKKIKDTGCDAMIFGGESGSPDILKMINKDITIDDILESGKKCKEFGFHGWFTFMSGFPNETVEDLYKTIDIMDKLYKIDNDAAIHLFSFVPLPQTELFEESVKLGMKRPETLEDWGEFRFQEHVNPWLSKKHKQMIRTLTYLVDFLFMTEASKKKRFHGWHKLAYRILLKDAEIRWKNRFFDIPYEWLLVRRYASGFYRDKEHPSHRDSNDNSMVHSSNQSSG